MSSRWRNRIFINQILMPNIVDCSILPIGQCSQTCFVFMFLQFSNPFHYTNIIGNYYIYEITEFILFAPRLAPHSPTGANELSYEYQYGNCLDVVRIYRYYLFIDQFDCRVTTNLSIQICLLQVSAIKSFRRHNKTLNDTVVSSIIFYFLITILFSINST